MYGYGELLKDVKYFSEAGAQVFSVGTSRLGREIYCFKVGGGGKPVVSTAAIHARENVSALVVRAQAEYALSKGARYAQYFIPLVNPDGAELLRRYVLYGEERYKMWKANAAGVDLNVNFDARWGTGRQNVFVAGGENYVGSAPFSEPESAALARFTQKVGAALTLSYHTQGREFYWYFYQQGENLERDRALAKSAEKKLKGKYARIDSAFGSAGGYKDWCIERLGIPSFTVELGSGAHPLKESDVEFDVRLNKGLAFALSEEINR